MQFDKVKMAEFKSAEAGFRKDLADITTRMHDRRATDKWTPEKDSQHVRDSVDHGVAERNLRVVRADITAMNDVRPLGKAEKDAPFRRFLAGGMAKLGTEERQLYCEPKQTLRQTGHGIEVFEVPQVRRAQMAALGATGTGIASGENIETVRVAGEVVDTLSYIGDALMSCYNFDTADGGEFRLPNEDNASQEGEILSAQDTTSTTLAMADFGQTVFRSFTCSSKPIYLAMEATVDATFDLVGYANRTAARRMARAWNKAMTVNAHGGSPQGMIGAAGEAFTTAESLKFDWEELVDLEYSVDRAYRLPMGEGAGAGFMLNGMGLIGYMISDTAEREFKQLKDTQGRPLWLPSIREGAPPTMNGVPSVVNGHMAAVAANAHPVAYGNFGSYGIRNIGGTQFYRFFDSATAVNNVSMVLAFNRKDGRCRLPLSSNANVAIQKLKIKA